MSVTIFSLSGQVGVGILADRGFATKPGTVVAAFEKELQRLSDAAGTS